MSYTYSSTMITSGNHNIDVIMDSFSIPQNSEEFQVRNSFVQLWKEWKAEF